MFLLRIFLFNAYYCLNNFIETADYLIFDAEHGAALIEDY